MKYFFNLFYISRRVRTLRVKCEKKIIWRNFFVKLTHLIATHFFQQDLRKDNFKTSYEKFQFFDNSRLKNYKNNVKNLKISTIKIHNKDKDIIWIFSWKKKLF